MPQEYLSKHCKKNYRRFNFDVKLVHNKTILRPGGSILCIHARQKCQSSGTIQKEIYTRKKYMKIHHQVTKECQNKTRNKLYNQQRKCTCAEEHLLNMPFDNYSGTKICIPVWSKSEGSAYSKRIYRTSTFPSTHRPSWRKENVPRWPEPPSRAS